MRLVFLDPTSDLASNIRTISRKLRINVVTYIDTFDTIIVVSNGTPDDQVMGIICHYCNGERIAGIAKPPGITGYAVIDLLVNYLKFRIKNIVILKDQEQETIDEVFKNFKERLNKNNIKHNLIKKEARLMIYNCSHAGREFRIIFILNGLDKFEKHSIEDHLVKCAEEFLKVKIDDKKDPKKVWKGLTREQQEEIFKKLKERKNKAYLIFPQHFEAFKFLEKTHGKG